MTCEFYGLSYSEKNIGQLWKVKKTSPRYAKALNFRVGGWINNRIKSNSCAVSPAWSKKKKPANLSIASFGLRAVFANVPIEKSYSSALYREKEDSDPHLVLSFYHHLDPLHQWTKFSTKICVGFFY